MWDRVWPKKIRLRINIVACVNRHAMFTGGLMQYQSIGREPKFKRLDRARW